MDADLRQEYIAVQEAQRGNLSAIGENLSEINDFVEMWTNGQKDSYEAWKWYASNHSGTKALTEKSGIPNFQYHAQHYAAPPTNERAAEIAEEYARIMGML
jgi:hypothetical protein